MLTKAEANKLRGLVSRLNQMHKQSQRIQLAVEKEYYVNEIEKANTAILTYLVDITQKRINPNELGTSDSEG